MSRMIGFAAALVAAAAFGEGGLERLGLEYKGCDGGQREGVRLEIPAYGDGVFNCTFRNVSGTGVWVRACLDVTTAEGSRRYWGLGGHSRDKENFSIRIPGVFDLNGKGKARLSVFDRRRGLEAVVWERDVAYPEYIEVETPHYRSSVSTARRESDIRLALKLNAWAERTDGRTAEVRMISPEGRELVRTNVTFGASDRVAFRMPLPWGSLPGAYLVQASIPRLNGNGLAKVEREFKVVEVKKGQVFVDQDGALLKDGAPWFPLGFYHVWPSEIEDVATTGADLIQFWDAHSTLGPTGTLARIAQSGMKVLLEDGIWGQVVNTAGNPPKLYPFENDPSFRAREEALRDDPSGAIGLWYVADEPGWECIPGMRRSNRHRREMDPDHPTFVCSTGDLYVGLCGDILGLDIYTRYNCSVRPLTDVADAIDRARRFSGGRQCIISAGQAFGHKRMHGEEPEDVRAMAYLAVIHGAKGIIWYTWHDGGNQGVVFHPETRKTVTAVIAEIHTVAPALFVPNASVEARSADGNVHALLCGNETSGRYLLLVNGSDDAVSTSLRLDVLKGASLEPLFGSAAADEDDGVVPLSLAGKATAVYRVTF